ncbi:MAG: hypothetical protein GY855_11040 [candidate division Zixibacteria bacterium]|nr:hypothetical protein [candidate division Zixibacteria bacterium]
MTEMPWPEKLRKNLKDFIDESERKKLINGSGDIDKAAPKEKAAWVKSVMAKFDRLIPDDKDRRKIMKECSCSCQYDSMEDYKAEYDKHKDIDKLIDYLHGKAFLNKPIRDGNTIYITKAPAFPDEYKKAKTKEEKRYYFCHCEYARASDSELSSTYCYCGAGWCQRIWEGILGHPVEIEVVESVLHGGDVCKFAVHI